MTCLDVRVEAGGAEGLQRQGGGQAAHCQWQPGRRRQGEHRQRGRGAQRGHLRDTEALTRPSKAQSSVRTHVQLRSCKRLCFGSMTHCDWLKQSRRNAARRTLSVPCGCGHTMTQQFRTYQWSEPTLTRCSSRRARRRGQCWDSWSQSARAPEPADAAAVACVRTSTLAFMPS